MFWRTRVFTMRLFTYILPEIGYNIKDIEGCNYHKRMVQFK